MQLSIYRLQQLNYSDTNTTIDVYSSMYWRIYGAINRGLFSITVDRVHKKSGFNVLLTPVYNSKLITMIYHLNIAYCVGLSFAFKNVNIHATNQGANRGKSNLKEFVHVPEIKSI